MSMILDGDWSYTVPMKRADSEPPKFSLSFKPEMVGSAHAEHVVDMERCAANCGAFRSAEVFNLGNGIQAVRFHVAPGGCVDLVIDSKDTALLGKLLTTASGKGAGG